MILHNRGYVPGGKITFRSRLSLSRFFSVSRPLTLPPEAVVISWCLGIGILIGRPAFLWRIDSSNNDFNCTSDSLDFECSSLKQISENKKMITKGSKLVHAHEKKVDDRK